MTLRKRIFAVVCVAFVLFFSCAPAAYAAEDIYTVSGVWQFDDEISQLVELQNVNFTYVNDAGVVRDMIGIHVAESDTGVCLFYKHSELTTGYSVFRFSSDDASKSIGWVAEYFRTIDFGAEEQKVSADFYNWLISNATKAPEPISVGDAVLDVFSSAGIWMVDAVTSASAMFYVDGSLTFVGILSVAALALAVILLVIYLLAGWIKFR